MKTFNSCTVRDTVARPLLGNDLWEITLDTKTSVRSNSMGKTAFGMS
jgi:hypothetical protein